MQIKSKFVHTNIISADWKKLASFYVSVFGCKILQPERDYSGESLSEGTALKNASLKGAHLLLPGWGESGPTLEIFSYSELIDRLPAAVNRPGFTHIAFEVEDVHSSQKIVLENGGGKIGEVVTLATSDGRNVTWCYVTDPEGNIIELQSWS